MNADVLIIGAGPAGCLAATICARAGLKTILLCGKETLRRSASAIESIHPGAESLLAFFGGDAAVKRSVVGTYGGIRVGSRYHALGEDLHGAWLGYHIDRTLFDEQMLHYAAAQGVQVQGETVRDFNMNGERVAGVATLDGNRIGARYVIDASGYVRLAGRKLGLEEVFYSPPLVAWTGTCRRISGTDFEEPLTARFLPSANGWTWLAPLPGGACTWTRVSTRTPGIYAPPAEVADCLPTGRVKVSSRRWRIFRPLCREGVILCGDAGGIIDPAAGQGILNALLSGQQAAETVCRILQEPHLEPFLLARYDDWFLETFKGKVATLKAIYALHEFRLDGRHS